VGRPVGEAFSFKVGHPASFRTQWIDEIDPRDRERIQRLWETHAAYGAFDAEYRSSAATARSAGSTTARSRSPTATAGWCASRASPKTSPSARAASLRSRELIETAPDAIVIIDASGHVLLVNAQTETLFGYERAELMGAPVEILLPERYRERHREHRTSFLAAPRARSMGRGIDLYALRKGGEEFPVEISLSPLETDSGPVISASIRDITEVRYAQRELARKRDALEAANHDLARSNSELEQFASVASHDLQEPLRKLVSFAELLRSDLGGELSDRAAQDLEFITDAARRMRTLVATCSRSRAPARAR
jgi:PAS domain S-box-containing protein